MPKVDGAGGEFGTWRYHHFTDLDTLLVWVKSTLADGSRADYSTVRFLRDDVIPWLIRRIQELEAPTGPDLEKAYDHEKT